MIYSLKEFLDNIIIESLHPELKDIVQAKAGRTSKKILLMRKTTELIARGEKTGFEGNMPSGSSRAYMPHEEHEDVVIDNKPAKMKVGTKVAIKANLDTHHNKKKYDGMGLGQLQNKAEGDDYLVNSNYRVLTKSGHENPNHYKTNTESGIFPPLVDHDHDNHEWSQVGHVENINESEFSKYTRTPEHPKGITHTDFCNALSRQWGKDHGNYWDQGPTEEARRDHITKHPLVQKFLDHQRNFSMPPFDYDQIENMGKWKHPHTGEYHIVARDHGFNDEVMNAYKDSRKARDDANFKKY